MYCKYCGEQIPDSVSFCTRCGKDLRPHKDPIEEAYRPALPFALLAAILIAPELILLCLNLSLLTVAVSFRMADLAVGGLILFIGVHRLKIDTRTYRWSDAPALFCLLFVWPWASHLVRAFFVGRFVGTDGFVAEGIYTNLTGNLRLPCVWAAVGLLLLGLGRKGTWRPRKKHFLLLTAVLTAGSLAAFGISTACINIFSRSNDPMVLAGEAAQVWSALSWLWVVAVLTVLRRLGTGRIGPVAAAVAFLSIPAGEFLLTPVFLGLLRLGITSLGYVTGLASLLCLLITLLASLLHRGKARKP